MKRPGAAWKWLLLVAGTLFCAAASLMMGSVPMDWSDVARYLVDALAGRAAAADGTAEIFYLIRLPRVLMAAVVGALLAAVGTTLQALLRNPLADPYLLGVSSGAALGAVIGLLTGFFSPAPFACLGAMTTLAFVLVLSRVEGTPNVSMMVLAGVAVHSFTSSILTFVLSQARRYELSTILFWLLGSLDTIPYRTLVPLMLASAVGLAALFLFGPALNLLSQGDEAAQSLGLDVTRTKWALILLCAFLTGLAVTFNGIIPFVGLVVPHVTRLLFGYDHRRSLPLSALLGALLVMVADAVGRTVLAPQEIPVGVVTALLGAPFFLYVLRRERRKLL
jgi:iron complex transport system permease protein